MHFQRHGRFYLAAAAGLAAFLSRDGARLDLRILFAGDAYFVAYLGLMAVYALRLTPERLRLRAVAADEGVAFILVLSALAVCFSLGSIFVILNHPDASEIESALLAVASVPLGWATLHTMTAFHYATMFYAPGDDAEAPVRGGLRFPGTNAPGVTEFLYFAFALGVAAQVSDVPVETSRFRRAVLLHSVGSFFYNTVLLALAVNAGLTFAGGTSGLAAVGNASAVRAMVMPAFGAF